MHSCIVATYRHPESLPCKLLSQSVEKIMEDAPIFVSPRHIANLEDKSATLFLMDAGVDDPAVINFKMGIILPFDFDAQEALLKRNTANLRYYFDVMPKVRMAHQSHTIKASTVIPFPFVKTPDLPEEELLREYPIKFFFPRLSEWNEEHMHSLCTSVRDALLSVFSDLTIFEFILDIPERFIENRAGEKITFTDSEGKYITRMANARVLAGMNTIFNHELGFCYSIMSDSNRSDYIVGAEIIIDHMKDVEQVLTQVERVDNFWYMIWRRKENQEPSHPLRHAQTFTRFLATNIRDQFENRLWMFERALNFMRPMKPIKFSTIEEKHQVKTFGDDGSKVVRDSLEVFEEKIDKVLKMV